MIILYNKKALNNSKYSINIYGIRLKGDKMQDIRFDEKFEFSINNIGFVNVERNKNHTFEYKNGKDRFSFIFVEKGSLEYSFGIQKILINKGCLLYIPKNIPYKTKYLDNGTKIKIVLFDTVGVLPPFLVNWFFKYSLDIQKVFDCLSVPNANNLYFLTSKLYDIFHLLQNEISYFPKTYQKIIPAIKDININYFENHKIIYYAKLCNMSESNFRKLFRENVGKSPIEYRNHIRIIEFKRLISSGEFTKSEAAYVVGFNNMSFFYEVYNKYTHSI